ncbi:MAG: class II fumarate hydratase [Acidobacteriia bacterium]|nr:class II fumarate hydratase [Terriglobia bacterium]
MMQFRTETDSMGEVQVAGDRLWGAQTQRALEHFQIGEDRFPAELVSAYAVLKKAAAIVNHRRGLLDQERKNLIVQVCDEILSGLFRDQFPLPVWISGSGTQFNMNVNEVIANRVSQLTGAPMGSKRPVHPNDHVNLSQSTNDSFPSAMSIAAAQALQQRLIPAIEQLRDAIRTKADAWRDIVKIGRTHLQDATPLTLGQEFSGYAGLLDDNLGRLHHALAETYRLALGGTAVGTGINAPAGFDQDAAEEIARLTGLPFVAAPNKFTVQGSHDALVQLGGVLRTLAVSLYKIANDIRLLSSGPRCGLAEIRLPENEPGSSIMPGKVNPTQCEVLAMISVQVMANDIAVAFGGSGGYLEMNVYKPLMIFNLMKSIRLLEDGCRSFRIFLIEGVEPEYRQIDSFLNRSLMLVTALSPSVGYDKASQVAHHALEHDLSLKDAALQLGVVSAEEFDRIVDPKKMVMPG